MSATQEQRRESLTTQIAGKKQAVRKDEERFRNWYRICTWGALVVSALTIFVGATDAATLPQQTKNYVVMVLGALNAVLTALATNAGLDKKWEEESAHRSELEVLEAQLPRPDADLDKIEEKFVEIVRSDRVRR